MKKYFFPVMVSLILGVLMAYFIIREYDNIDGITVSSSAETLYYIQRGVYSDLENMQNNMQEFENYIYNVEDNMYYTYIGISSTKENATKIQEYYKKIGYETIIKEKITDNEDFIKVLKQYDELLNSVENDESIKVICNQILSKYEELLNGEYNN